MDMEPAICAITKAESIENTDVITMRNINKSYRMGTQSLHVLKDVSLTLAELGGFSRSTFCRPPVSGLDIQSII